MSATTVPVEFLFRLDVDTVSVPPQMILGGPQGSRLVATAASGTVDGPKVKGIVAPGAGGDWVTMRDDGTFRLDVRVTLLTDDGAAILSTYNGVGVPDGAGGFSIKAAPTFETGDDRYRWLNNVQALSYGTVDATGVHYEIFALADR